MAPLKWAEAVAQFLVSLPLSGQVSPNRDLLVRQMQSFKVVKADE